MPDLYDISSYDYELPHELIAQHPLADRDQSRMMVLNRKESSISHHNFSEITGYLKPGDLLIVNSSKVFPARLFGTKANGTKVEILLMHEQEDKSWKAMVHPGKRLKTEQELIFSEHLKARISLPDEDGFRTLWFD
ncbi:MAG TPA: S-adenosylmethionine:tRNA ribosyltransferase-isomerase, partial [Candidatus Cloacimonadota bacterium]|nr:S-adenosylmethionine:tRNA ribosyltransferase-isomerase [Candidatus Cloacimonadota bacterium]